MPAYPRDTAGEFLHGVGVLLNIQDVTMLSLTVDGIEPKLTMPISSLATRNLEIRINENASYQHEVNEVNNDAVKQIESILRGQSVAGDDYQDITETPEAGEIIRLLRVLLEGYKVQTRGPGSAGCDEIIDEIVTWLKEKVKNCQSWNAIHIALKEDFL